MTLETSDMKEAKRCISIGMQTLINFYGIRATITNVNQASFKELKWTYDVKSTMHYKQRQQVNEL